MSRTQKIALSAVFAALIFCATFFIKVPMVVVGYVNLGDCLVLSAGWLLGPVWGGAAGAIGSALADLSGGYAIYMLPTFLIKGGMAILAWLIWHLLRTKLSLLGRVLGAILAEGLMVGGYLLFECISYGGAAALASVPFNLIQGAFGAVLSVLLTELLTRAKASRRFFHIS